MWPISARLYTGEAWYVPGPGTRYRRVGRILGGVAGMGGHARVGDAYEQLCKNWAVGDTLIDIIGFSRGAALALEFGNKIEEDGIRRTGSKEVIADRPPIRFLGLWDTVGSFGIPIDWGSSDSRRSISATSCFCRPTLSIAFTPWRWMSAALGAGVLAYWTDARFSRVCSDFWHKGRQDLKKVF